jgi:hypothetical protein
MPIGLPISRLIDVQINLSPLPAQAPSLNTCLVLGTSTVIDLVERMRTYTSLSQVATDFGTSAPEYLCAVLWFEQRPAPTELKIGRWAQTAAAGELIGGGVTTAHQLISYWTAITTGSFKITIDGGMEQSLTGLNFSAVSNLNAVATVINGVLTGADIFWDANQGRFYVESDTTGASSTVSFAGVGASGTDISASLALTAATSAYQSPGVAAQTIAATLAIFDNMFSNQWYGLIIPTLSDADDDLVVQAADYIEADTIKHYYGVTSQDTGCLSAASTTDLAYILNAGGYLRTACQYSSQNAYAATSYLSRILTTNWSGNNTAITLMYKQEPGIVAERLTETQAQALQDKKCNVFVVYNNDTAIIQYGTSASGQYTDSVVGTDWLRGAIQTNLFNLLYGTSTKIPQTDPGNHQLATGITAACQQGVNNGLIAPGVWTANGFGQLKSGDYLTQGFYVYAPPVSSQSSADRAAKKSVSFRVAVTLGGAIHVANVGVDVVN